MTLIHAAWAIDGARSTSALARTATYAIGGGHSGVVRAYDLKVTPLAVPSLLIVISRAMASVSSVRRPVAIAGGIKTPTDEKLEFVMQPRLHCPQ